MTVMPPPTSFALNIQAFTHNIRVHQRQHYSDFTRQHIINVIQQTFPHFSRHHNLETLTQYADTFVRQHHAVDPEFHQIATEFVRFMQGNSIKNPALLSLLEYEWVLFTVSILPSPIFGPNTLPVNPTLCDNYYIYLNPTLYCIEVPFIVTQDGPVFVNNSSHHYAIFRHFTHAVHYKPLNPQERYFIQKIPETDGIALKKMDRNNDVFNT
ncbi:MAG: putative DNA-binding domain-containing protein [Gammaproteobacteria bacterium]|nr:putative DNA-binding domain-containing protein [Gammaproteobacteria bacterium]